MADFLRKKRENFFCFQMVDANQRWDVDEAIQYMKNVRAGWLG